MALLVSTGHSSAAINGYWSPLLSWLLIPLLWVGTDPLVAMKLLGIVIGLAVLVTAARLGRVVGLNRASCRLLVGTLVPIVLYCAYSVVTPDLLETLLVAAYLSVILRRDFLERRSFALAAGCLGALAFLAKAYALPFVGVTFVCLSLWQRFAAGASWRRLFFTWLLFGAAFAAVAAPWVVLISWKYHKLTCGTTGGFNFALIGPETIEHPMWSQGLFAPPNPFALSAWEDLGLLPFRPWSPFASTVFFTFWLRSIAGNLAQVSASFSAWRFLRGRRSS